MAGHLSKGGHEVTVYNRTAAKATQLAKKFGGKTAKTPRDAAKGKEIVFVCVGNDNDLRSVVLGDKGTLAGMSRGTILPRPRMPHASSTEALAKQVLASSMRLFPVVKPVRRKVR